MKFSVNDNNNNNNNNIYLHEVFRQRPKFLGDSQLSLTIRRLYESAPNIPVLDQNLHVRNAYGSATKVFAFR